MSKDIHKWTDGRYTLMFDEHTFFVWDNVKEERMTALETTKRLNEQQSTIQRFEEYVFSDERIICYNCLFCQEKDIYEVKCERKGSVDVHGICQYYEKKR